MAESTKITWCNSTFNPWRGCTKVSQGCKFCYAEKGSRRNPKVLGVWGDEGTRVLAAEAQWNEPVKWHRQAGMSLFTAPWRVFCASLADVFEEWDGQMTDPQERPLWVTPARPEAYPTVIPTTTLEPYTLDHARRRLWDLIRDTPHLTWLLLTKRPENITTMMPTGKWPNVWLGTTVEDADNVVRIDLLQDAPQEVPVRFLSCEPLLGPLDLSGVLGKGGIQWVIVGGESGAASKARTMKLAWVRDIIEQCKSAKVACFVKQLGTNPECQYPADHAFLPTLHPKGATPEEWPFGLRVQEFPV